MKISKLLTLDMDLIAEFNRIGGNLSGTINELLRDHLEKNSEFLKKSIKETEKSIKSEKKKLKSLKNELVLAENRKNLAEKALKSRRYERFY